MASPKSTSLGELDFRVVQEQVQYVSSDKRSQDVKYSDVPRFNIAKCAKGNGPAVTIKNFSSKFTAFTPLNFL